MVRVHIFFSAIGIKCWEYLCVPGTGQVNNTKESQQAVMQES